LVVGRPPGGRAGELAIRGKLTNTSPRRQNVAEIRFKVWLNNPDRSGVEPVVLPVQAEYLEADKSIDFTATRSGQAESPLKVYKVEQKLDARYAPVKRVDRLELGYKSQRFAGKELVKAAISEAAAGADPQPAPASTAPVQLASIGGGPNTDLTPNGIPRLRYLEKNDQVRRMPVGVVLVVDQAHVQDVLRAFANSRLRFQNTQYHLSRFRDVISLDTPEMSTGGAPASGAPVPPGAALPPAISDVLARKMGRGGPGGKRTGDDSRTGGPGRREARHPSIPGGSSDSGSASADEESNTLVELTVYGLISLYERFPPRAAATGAAPAGTPTPAGTPAPAAAPVVPTAPPPVPYAPSPPPAPTGGALPLPPPPGPNPTAPPAKPPG
jgi:hypothetical protein